MASSDTNNSSAVPMDTTPKECSAGCGFFGNPNTGNMCSKCYKETLAKAKAASEAVSAPAAAPAAAAPCPPCTTPVEPAVPAPPKVEEKSAAAASSAAAEPGPAVLPRPASPKQKAVETTPAEDEQPPKKKQVNTNRCWGCNKKIGLLGFKCKCEYYFCAEHRYSDKHECVFDYKAQGKELLTKSNPVIAPAKLESM